ncbi:putative reverse transcriptase domain-containing protein [Tanacetum coccineum]
MRNSTNGDRSHSSHEDNRSNAQTARPCFYADFMKCQPLNFKGTEGVKFATCILLGAALTWWNGQIRTLGPEAYKMTWEGLKKKMMDKYCPQGEIQKLEIELWNLKVKGNDVPAYTKRFQNSVLKTTVPLGGCPIAFLSTGNICVSRTPAVAGKVPYLIALVALLGAWAIVVKMALGALGQVSPLFRIRTKFLTHQVVGQLNRLIQCLGFGRLHISINVVRESTSVLVEFLVMTKAPTGEDLGEPLSHDSKAQEYTEKGCQIFLAQISAKKEEDKSEGKQLQDVPIVRYFPEVFPEDLPGLLPARPVESIILILHH